AFAGAPRYHTGGIAGLRPGEVPAILKKREEVLTEDDPRHRFNGGREGAGAAPPRNMRFIFVDDERDVSNWLRTTSDEVFVEKLNRNATALRSILGGA
ncbi:MAG TPA: hypothetical protein PLN31_19470, partial [Azoarcus taiwanensis]|nr:hypothetical protein [Rhodocyclaceae bacterium]HRQ59602.1 hypothetical protein [Azoarcus taiwanensis]